MFYISFIQFRVSYLGAPCISQRIVVDFVGDRQIVAISVSCQLVDKGNRVCEMLFMAFVMFALFLLYLSCRWDSRAILLCLFTLCRDDDVGVFFLIHFCILLVDIGLDV